MAEVSPIITSLADHFKLSSKQCWQSSNEEDEISLVPYTGTISPVPHTSAVESLIYVMVCTRPD